MIICLISTLIMNRKQKPKILTKIVPLLRKTQKRYKKMPELNNLVYFIIYNIYSTSESLANKGIIKTSICKECSKTDSLRHRIVDCGKRNIISKQYYTQNYQSYDSFISTLSHPQRKPYNFLPFKFLEMKKTRIMFWITIQTLYIKLKQKCINSKD